MKKARIDFTVQMHEKSEMHESNELTVCIKADDKATAETASRELTSIISGMLSSHVEVLDDVSEARIYGGWATTTKYILSEDNSDVQKARRIATDHLIDLGFKVTVKCEEVR